MKKFLTIILSLLVVLSFLTGCGGKKAVPSTGKTVAGETKITETGTYTSKDQVALYVHTYNKLPKNFITKAEARKLGWQSKGTLDKIAPGKSIGGDHFGNAEKKLPSGKGIRYTECDIDYVKGNRGAKRIVFDNKGNIYYCGDHYNTFEKIY